MVIRKEKNTVQFGLFFFVVALIQWIIALVFFDKLQSGGEIGFVKYVYELSFGITLFFGVWSWKKISGSWFNPYSIFFLFLILFNAGQFLMWGFGIHYYTQATQELGRSPHIRLLSQVTLLKTMMITLPAVNFFHSAALLSSNKDDGKISSILVSKTTDKDRINARRKALYNVGIVCLILAYSVVIYKTIGKFQTVQLTGYTSLYYGDNGNYNALIKYISYMFFPSFFAVFVGSNYSKKTFIRLSVLLAPYIIINILIGDRGAWLVTGIIWFWCYSEFILKAQTNQSQMRWKILKLAIWGIVLLFIVTLFAKFREVGISNITNGDVTELINNMGYVFIKPIFEMGQSARVTAIIIEDNINKAMVGGNTYIAGILSMVLPRIKLLFGFPDGYLDNWFSQTYLGLHNYGAGFTMVGEAYLNGGIWFFPFYMLLLGFVIGKIANIKLDYSNVEEHDPFRVFMMLASTPIFVTICRESVELSLRKWFYGVVVILMFAALLKKAK